MSAEDSSGNGRHILTAFQQGQFAELLTSDAVIHDRAQGTSVRGRDAAEAFLYAFFRDGFSGATIAGAVVEMTADRVALALTFDGVQNGRFMGIPATGRAVQLSLALVCQLQENRIHHLELHYDAATLLRQLGLAL